MRLDLHKTRELQQALNRTNESKYNKKWNDNVQININMNMVIDANYVIQYLECRKKEINQL